MEGVKMTQDKPPQKIIEQKKSEVDQATSSRMEQIKARKEAYTRIIQVVKSELQEYYEAHPERIMDDKDVQMIIVGGAKKFLTVLDDYIISYRHQSSENNPDIPNHGEILKPIMEDK